jgi:hypothetical protein
VTSGHFIAVMLVMAVLITPATGALANVLPDGQKHWWLIAWIAALPVLLLVPDGTPVFVGLGFAAVYLAAAGVFYQLREEPDEDG